MTILYADGFELGTNLAEYNTLADQTMFGPGASTGVFSASTMGQGRSFKIPQTNTPNSACGINQPALTAAVLDATATIIFGFRGKLNSTFNGGQNVGKMGFGNYNDSNIFGLFIHRNAVSSTQCTLTTGTNSSVVGTPFNVPDFNTHYFTFIMTRMPGTQTFNNVLYCDATILSTSATSITWQSLNPFTIDGPYTQITGTDSRVFSEIDDIYIGLNQDPLGDLIIQRVVPTTDVTANFTRFGSSLTSNHQAVDNINLAATTGLLVPTAATADVYGQATTTPTARRIAAVKTIVYGIGQSTDSLVATQKSGSLSFSSPQTPMSPFGAVVNTGWDLTLANTSLANLQFGVSKV